MAEILTTRVRGNAIVGGENVSTTYIEVERNRQETASYAKVKAIVDSPENIKLDDQLLVFINSDLIFVGTVNKAVQNENGIVVIEGYDVMYDMHNQRVKLSTEQPVYATDVARDLLDDSTVTNYYVAPEEDYPGTGAPQCGPRTVHRYGTAEAGERLSEVLADLAEKLGAVLWVTVGGQVRIEPYPDHNEYELQYITKMTAGGEKIGQKNILVKGGSPVSDLGQAAAHFNRQVDLTSTSRLPEPGQDGVESPQKTYRDDNVGTQVEADRTAMSLAREEVIKTTPGKVTIVGNTSPELFDTVIIPDATYQYNTGVNPYRVPGNALAESNLYQIKHIVHKANAKEGFLTTLDVTPAMKNVMDGLDGAAGAIATELTRNIDSNTTEKEPLGITQGFGG